MNYTVINGDNIQVLKSYPDNYFDAVVTDPPYGLGKEPDAVELMKDWVEHGYHEISGRGFMGKEWDAFVPQPIFWKEIFRVLKHGGHVLAFYGTRTYDWGVMAMRFAGFEVRDSIYWHYGSGFPKSHNISKAIDKMHGAEREIVGQREDILIKQANDLKLGKRKILDSLDNGSPERNNGFKNVSADITAPATEQAKQWEGWGSALKPASEPIVMARKPLEKGLSITENVLKWGTGAINIDGCRVATDEKIENHSRGEESAISKGKYGDSKEQETHQTEGQKLGRFPANLIMTHHPECECKGTKKVKSDGHHSGKVPESGGLYNLGLNQVDDKGDIYSDENGEETVEDWDCHEDCPIKIMDEQSGILKSGAMKKSYQYLNNGFSIGKPSGSTKQIHEASEGGASRFFYCAKASKSERNKGLDGFEEKRGGMRNSSGRVVGGQKSIDSGDAYSEDRMTKNFHPTVKPVKLMQYLVRLVTPPNGKVLDPFCGSGTTGIACKLEGFEFTGIEQDPEYTKIAQARIDNWDAKGKKVEKDEPKTDKKEEVIEQIKPIQTSLF